MHDKRFIRESITDAGYIFSFGVLFTLIIKYLAAFYNLPYRIVSNHPAIMVITAVGPFVIWFYSTSFDKWNYWNRKLTAFMLCILNMALVLIQPIYTWVWTHVARPVFSIPPTRNFDGVMILNLGRIILGGTVLLMVILMCRILLPVLRRSNVALFIIGIKWKKVFDTRPNKENLYDMKIMRNLKTGKWISIHENDRKTQMLFLGASGTGKTSSLFIPAIIGDLNHKLVNFLKRQVALKKLVLEGKAVVRAVKGEPVTEKNVVATEKKYEKDISDIFKKYGDCGTTVMAPNSAMNNDIIRAAKARKIVVNVVDPVNTYDKKKYPNVRPLKINPFYIPYGLPPKKRVEMIVAAGINFAEVMQSLNEQFGQGEQYFRDLSTSTTSNIAIVAMLKANMNHTQTSLPEIQEYIVDISRIAAVVKEVEEKLRLNIVVKSVKAGSSKDIDSGRLNHNAGMENGNARFRPITRESEIPEEYRHLGIDEYNRMLKEEGEYYYATLFSIHQELIGDGAEKMFDQLRGLRTLINKIMMEPHIKDLLSGREDNLLNFDEMLSDCQVTVINTALELGTQNSTAIGLFCMLNFSNAVKRRPLDNRPLHMLWIDEATQYMHPMYEDMIALYRQFNVLFALAIQDSSQMNKTRITQYLKSLLNTVGTHVVFGRVSEEVMRIYEAMGGAKLVETVQKTVNKNSIMEENYSRTEGGRTAEATKSNITGTDLRIRDFQEATVYTVKDGNVMDAQLVKVFFAKETDYKDMNVSTVDWSRLVPEGKGEIYKPVEEISREKIEKYREDSDRVTADYETEYTVSEHERVPEEEKMYRMLKDALDKKQAQKKHDIEEDEEIEVAKEKAEYSSKNKKEKAAQNIQEEKEPLEMLNLYDLLIGQSERNILDDSAKMQNEEKDDYKKMQQQLQRLNQMKGSEE